MTAIFELVEKDKHRATSTMPVIWNLVIRCEGYYEELQLFQKMIEDVSK